MLGAAGTAVVATVALALAVHLTWIAWRRLDSNGSVWSLWRAGLAVQVAVMLAVPALATVGMPVPGSLGALPLASDGASFLMTVVGTGLIVGSNPVDDPC